MGWAELRWDGDQGGGKNCTGEQRHDFFYSYES